MLLLIPITIGSLPLSAQDSRKSPVITIGAGIGYFVVGGDDFNATDDAAGVDGYLGWYPTEILHLRGGYHYGRHATASPFDLILHAVYLEPRIRIGRFGPAGTPVEWFLGGRVGWVERKFSSFTTSGYAVGGIAGILIGTDWSVQFEPTLSMSYLSFSPYFSDQDRDHGSAFGFQLGITVPFYR